jgi:hypothetical protein
LNIAKLAQAVPPGRRPSALVGAEHVRGFGVPAIAFSSGHVLGLRAFAQTDFGPYRSVWHREPKGAWTIYVDGVDINEACPRYFGTALRSSHAARIDIEWRGPVELTVRMTAPHLEWLVRLRSSPVTVAMNALLPLIGDRVWRTPAVPRTFERLAKRLLGAADMLATVPNGHLHLLAPQRMFLVATSRAVFAGQDLGTPIRARENPRIGAWRLPAIPVFAIGRGFFERGPVSSYATRMDVAAAARTPSGPDERVPLG